MTSTQSKSVPELRFEGFEGEWEEKILNSISERITRKNTNNESTLPLTISAQYGLVDQRDFFNSQIASKDVSGYYLIRNGEFAYNKSYSSEYPFGAIKRLDFYDKGVLSTLYILFSVKNIKSDYLLAYYDSTYWHREIMKIAAEGARNHGLLNVAPEDFFNTKLNVPKAELEQQQVGFFFKHLDGQILLTQEKLEKTKTLKKTMLKKMFPKKGSKVPEIRLEGFSGEWEEKPLGMIFGTTNQRNFPGLPVASASQEFGMIIRDQIGIDITYNKSNVATYKKVEPGNFVIHLRSFQGGFAHSSLTAITSPAYTIMEFHNKEEHDEYFWKYLFTSDDFIERLKIVTYGIRDGRSINFEDCAKLKFAFPKKQEQQKIGQFFKHLDFMVQEQSQKLDLLKTLKKSLLAKMFV